MEEDTKLGSGQVTAAGSDTAGTDFRSVTPHLVSLLLQALVQAMHMQQPLTKFQGLKDTNHTHAVPSPYVSHDTGVCETSNPLPFHGRFNLLISEEGI